MEMTKKANVATGTTHTSVLATALAGMTLGQRQALADAAALAVNLGLNAGWSAAFFRAKNRSLAARVAAALALSSADLVRRVAKRNTPRAVALSAYPAWCGFATALSGAITRLNSQPPRLSPNRSLYAKV